MRSEVQVRRLLLDAEHVLRLFADGVDRSDPQGFCQAMRDLARHVPACHRLERLA